MALRTKLQQIMDKEKRLMDIELDLGTFQAHIKRLRKKPGSVHRLDVELLQDKTRKLYDKLYELEQILLDKNGVQGRVIKLPENMPKAELPETTESTIVATPKTRVVETPAPKPVSIPKVEEKQEEKVNVEVKPGVEKPEVKETKVEPVEKKEIFKEKVPTPTTREVAREPKAKSEEKQSEVRSAFDLFTDSAEVSIGDKLGDGGDASIASKMQKSQIKDLKQAIGINEKFLFINELFNGDLGRYNKTIEEFNELSSREGTNAHLIELKIQNQWADDGEAFLKLKLLLDRKFN